MAMNFGLKKSLSKDEIITYDGTIEDVLLSEPIIKTLFSPNFAPEG